MDNNGDVYIPLLETNEDDAKLFIDEIYETILEIHNKTPDQGLTEHDMWYNMFPVKVYDTTYWWMPKNHAYVEMLDCNGVSYENIFNGSLGSVIVYEEHAIRDCVDSLIKLCKKYDKRVLSNK